MPHTKYTLFIVRIYKIKKTETVGSSTRTGQILYLSKFERVKVVTQNLILVQSLTPRENALKRNLKT